MSGIRRRFPKGCIHSMSWRDYSPVLMLCSVVACAGGAACRGRAEAGRGPAQAVTVKTTAPHTMSVQREVEVSGTLLSPDQALSASALPPPAPSPRPALPAARTTPVAGARGGARDVLALDLDRLAGLEPDLVRQPGRIGAARDVKPQLQGCPPVQPTEVCLCVQEPSGHTAEPRSVPT